MDNIEYIEYRGKRYPTFVLNIEGYGERRIATESLQDALITEDGHYMDAKARAIDETIFYFIEDKLVEGNLGVIAKQISADVT